MSKAEGLRCSTAIKFCYKVHRTVYIQTPDTPQHIKYMVNMVLFSTYCAKQWLSIDQWTMPPWARVWVGSLKMNTTLEYSTRVVQEGDRRCKKSTLNDLAYLTPLRIPLMNPVFVSDQTPGPYTERTVPEFIDPVFTKTSPKRSFSLNRKRLFWLVFAKTGSIISGTDLLFDG